MEGNISFKIIGDEIEYEFRPALLFHKKISPLLRDEIEEIFLAFDPDKIQTEIDEALEEAEKEKCNLQNEIDDLEYDIFELEKKNKILLDKVHNLEVELNEKIKENEELRFRLDNLEK